MSRPFPKMENVQYSDFVRRATNLCQCILEVASVCLSKFRASFYQPWSFAGNRGGACFWVWGVSWRGQDFGYQSSVSKTSRIRSIELGSFIDQLGICQLRGMLLEWGSPIRMLSLTINLDVQQKLAHGGRKAWTLKGFVNACRE